MYISVSNKIYVHEASNQVFDWCRKHLEFSNPEFSKAERMGFWTGRIEPIIVLWEKRGDDAILPHGCLKAFTTAFPSIQCHYEYAPVEEHIDYKSQISLFSYQKRALESIQGKSGVLVMPCGSGKTQTALQIIAKYGLRALWITHTKELMNQSMNRAKSCFGIDPGCIGTITDGKVNVGSAVTFSTVQTLCSIDLLPYKDYWAIIIVDECHKAIGTPTKLMMFYKVVSQLSAPIKIGLTATPKRSDGLEKCVFALLGPLLCEISKDEVKQNTVPIRVLGIPDHSIDQSKIPESDYTNFDGTLNYTRLIDIVCKSTNRNKKICSIIEECLFAGKTCLVLSDRVEHLNILRNLVNNEYTAVLKSSATTPFRKEVLFSLQNRKIGCVFATYQLAKEGLDIPSLDCVILATPKKDPITVVQSCGRVGRVSPGKKFGVVIDIQDPDFWIFNRYAKARKSIYKKEKYEIFS